MTPPPGVTTCLHMEAKLVENAEKCQTPQSWHIVNVPDNVWVFVPYLEFTAHHIGEFCLLARVTGRWKACMLIPQGEPDILSYMHRGHFMAGYNC